MDMIERRSTALRANPTLRQLYDIIFEKGNALQALYLDAAGVEQTVTWDKCRERALAAAQMIRNACGAGGWVALSLDTCPEWLTLFFAILLSGNQPLLLDPNASDDLTAYLMRQADTGTLITARQRPGLTVSAQLTAAELMAAPAAERFSPDSFGTKVALCTSGTTRTSRVFVYDEQALCQQLLNSELLHRLNRRIIDGEQLTRNLVFLPCHHVFGFLVCMLWMSFIGGENVYLRDRSPETILHTSQRFGVTMLITVPLLLNHLCAALRRRAAGQDEKARLLFSQGLQRSEDLQRKNPERGLATARERMFGDTLRQLLGDKIRCVIIGGSFAPDENLRLFNQLGYYTVVGFGMTETGVTSVESDMSYDIRLSGSVGKPFDSAQYRVVDPGADGIGELAIRGGTLHTARLENGVELPPELDGDGWFLTGDLVRTDADGRLYIIGRSKDLIINESGENVYPDELEATFVPPAAIDAYSVVGVRRRPGEKYEDITLVVHRQPGTDPSDSAALREAVRELNARLPVMKQITRLVMAEEPLPLSASMKVQRYRLRQLIADGAAGFSDISLSGEEPAAAPAASPEKAPPITDSQEIKDWVRKLYAEVLGIEPESISDDARFSEDLKGDSLGLVSLAVKAEETFHVVIEPHDYGECTTVRGAAQLIERLQKGDHAEAPKQPEKVRRIERFEDTPEYRAFIEREQKLMHDDADNPYFVCHESPLTDRSLMDGHWVLNFGSYNYAGMSGRPETKEAAKAAIDKYGTSASGSRLLGGEKQLHRDLEHALARWKHTEDCLVLVGGHSTNVTIVGHFCGEKDLILYDAIDHNSIMEGLAISPAKALPFMHNDLHQLETLLKMNRDDYEKVLIVVEGVYSMDGDIAPIPEYVRLKKQYGCFLMVDEAHSACVLGDTGGGVDEYFGLQPDDIDIKMGTLSKGLGTCGGYLAGKHALIDYLRYNLPGFVFSVGMSPPLAAASLRAVQLLQENPAIMADLHRNIRCFAEEATARRFDIGLAGRTAIIPILIGEDADAFLLSNMLRKKGVFVPPAVYPAVPRGKARLRFCVTSCHQPDQIREALDKLAECVEEAGITLPNR